MQWLIGLILCLTLLVVSCTGTGKTVKPDTQYDNYEIKLLFEIDGIKMYRFFDGRYHYFTTRDQTITQCAEYRNKQTIRWDEKINGE